MPFNHHYHFPRTRFVKETGIVSQLFHIISEFFEVVVALLRRDYAHAIHEAYDLIGSVETLIRKLVHRAWRKGDMINPAIIKADVREKNVKRGYYT